jgi:hypothetical protein
MQSLLAFLKMGEQVHVYIMCFYVYSLVTWPR